MKYLPLILLTVFCAAIISDEIDFSVKEENRVSALSDSDLIYSDYKKCKSCKKKRMENPSLISAA